MVGAARALLALAGAAGLALGSCADREQSEPSSPSPSKADTPVGNDATDRSAESRHVAERAEDEGEDQGKGSGGCQAEPPAGLVDLAEAVDGLVLDIRYARADNFTGAPLPGYEVAAAWMAPEPAAALAKVQADLAEEGYGLVVYDAYRPARATRAMVDWAQRTGRTDLLDAGYIARTSTHARGNTVDLGLVVIDTAGSVVDPAPDMGSPFDTFSSASHYGTASGDAAQRRRILRRAMERRGFAPYAREWWHFSYPQEGLKRRDVPYACPRDGAGELR